MAESGHLRINGARVSAGSHAVTQGDVLTIPRGTQVLVAEILALPDRRGPASEAQSCYRMLDPHGENAIADTESPETQGPE